MKTFNKKVILSMMLAVLLAPAALSARVYFMESTDTDAKEIDVVRPCILDYPKRSCPDGKTPQNFCPSDNRYFKSCGCDSTVYRFDESNCNDNKTLGGSSCDGEYTTCTCDAKYKYNSTNCTDNKTLSGSTCDGKYEACSCDSSKYKYDNTNCTDNKTLSGNACSGKYETCDCDTNTYKEECNSPEIGVGQACNNKYASCTCPESWGSCNDMGPAVGATKCEIGGAIKYSSCCSCSGYTKDLTDANAASYDTCSCNGSFKKVKTCKTNYTLSDGKCVHASCNGAIEEFIAKNSSYSMYGVYKGSALSNSKYIVGEDTAGVWSHFYNKNVISGYAFANQLSSTSEEAAAVKNLCTAVPNISMSGDSIINSPVTFSAVKITAVTVYNDSTFTCTNCSIEINNLHSANKKNPRTGVMYLKYDSSMVNKNNMYVKSKELGIDNTFSSEGYNYDISTSVSIGGSAETYSYPVFIKGLSGNKITFKTPFMRIRFVAVGFSYATVYSKKTLIGVYGAPTSSESNLTPDNSMTPVSLYYTDWMMYDTENGTVNNYLLYLGKVAILGYLPDIDRDSNQNTYGNKIKWSNGTSSARCRAAGAQNHCKNGTNSCNNRLSGTKYAYVNSSGNRVARTHPAGCSEWCKDSNGSNPIDSNTIGKIYINKYSWVKGGGRMKLECY